MSLAVCRGQATRECPTLARSPQLPGCQWRRSMCEYLAAAGDGYRMGQPRCTLSRLQYCATVENRHRQWPDSEATRAAGEGRLRHAGRCRWVHVRMRELDSGGSALLAHARRMRIARPGGSAPCMTSLPIRTTLGGWSMVGDLDIWPCQVRPSDPSEWLKAGAGVDAVC